MVMRRTGSDQISGFPPVPDVFPPVGDASAGRGDSGRSGAFRNDMVDLVSSGALVIAFLLIGAWVLEDLELPAEKERAAAFHERRAALEKVLQDNTHALYTDHPEVHAMILNYTSHVEQYIHTKDSAPNLEYPNWDYKGSLFFMGTVMTTIGYGTYAPKTTEARVFIILMCLASIPITTMFLGNVIKVMSSLAGMLVSKGLGARGEVSAGEDNEGWDGSGLRELRVGRISNGVWWVVAIAFVCVSSTLLDDVVEGAWEETLYFVIISLTTVGLGDYAPNFNEEGAVTIFLTILFWMFGLALVGSCLEQIQEWFQSGLDIVLAHAKGGGAEGGGREERDKEVGGS